jgi:hypothetical protein
VERQAHVDDMLAYRSGSHFLCVCYVCYLPTLPPRDAELSPARGKGLAQPPVRRSVMPPQNLTSLFRSRLSKYSTTSASLSALLSLSLALLLSSRPDADESVQRQSSTQMRK